mmetsp:Transcript_77933/g.152485  ORF Transcript_77933/g.152485 Transcript_77933/m.152485 type:complete len:270 (+) Transcript_77933:321-1130(+)
MAQSSSHAVASKCWSWDTTTTPPWKFLMASTSASVVSMSKWFVGSSRISKCGLRYMAAARHTRHFCPPDSVWIFCTGSTSPPNPNRAKWLRIDWVYWLEPLPGNFSSMVLSGVPRPSSCSSWCCATYSIFAEPSTRHSPPRFGRSCPTMSLMRVLLPHPLRPKRAIRLLDVTWKSTFERRFGIAAAAAASAVASAAVGGGGGGFFGSPCFRSSSPSLSLSSSSLPSAPSALGFFLALGSYAKLALVMRTMAWSKGPGSGKSSTTGASST